MYSLPDSNWQPNKGEDFKSSATNFAKRVEYIIKNNKL